MGIVLGIDYGDKRIGLALSDPKEKLARRFLTLKNNAAALEELKKIIENEEVVKIVIGIPVGFKQESEQTEKVRNFILQIKKEIEIPIEEMNEILTSKMAQKNLLESETKDAKEIIDQEAARIILQDYLDIKNRIG